MLVHSELTASRLQDKIYFMFDYAICEIGGKQYKFTPDKEVEVDFLDDQKSLEAKVLLMSENGKVKIGTPYLKEKVTLKYIDTKKGDKIRVAKFHAKANFRKVTGHRAKRTRLLLSVKNKD